MEGAASSMPAAMSTAFTTILGWMSEIVNTITASPLYLLALGIFVVGGVIGLAYRLIHGG